MAGLIMRLRNYIGNLNMPMRHSVFCWIGGAVTILIVPVISALEYTVQGPIHTGKIQINYPGRSAPSEISLVSAERYISAALRFIKMPMDGMIRSAKIYTIIRP